MTSIHDSSPFRVRRKHSVVMSPRAELVSILPASPHLVCRDVTGFPSKAMDQIIGHRGYLSIRESSPERRHECGGIDSPKVRSREQRLHEIGAVGIIHGLTAQESRVTRLPSPTVPQMAADAVSLKKPPAKTILMILGSRLFRIRGIDPWEPHFDARHVRLRLDRSQIANERRSIG